MRDDDFNQECATQQIKRKNALARAGDISLDVRDIKLAVKDAKHASTVFKQAYRSEQFKDVVLKTLEWEQIDGRWLIKHLRLQLLWPQRIVGEGFPREMKATSLG